MLSVFGCEMTANEIARASSCLESQWIGMGQEVASFEREFSEARGLSNFVMCDSGSNALYLALRALDLPEGSEVIVPTFTWIACATSVLLAGLRPVFCDIDPSTMNVRAEDVAVQMTSDTSAIMVVHFAGLPVDLHDIRQFNLPIIEDCAHAVDSMYKGVACGSQSEASIFSFDSVKNLAVGEGGGVTFRDSSHADRARELRYCGIAKSGFQAASDQAASEPRWWEYDLRGIAPKMLPTDIAASIGRVQLKRLPEMQDRRRRLWEMYNEELDMVPGLLRPLEAPRTDRHSYFTYSIRVPQRDELARFLLDRGIYTTLRYQPLHYLPIFEQRWRDLPNSEALNEIALSIPLHPRMTSEDVLLVSDSIKEFFGEGPPERRNRRDRDFAA